MPDDSTNRSRTSQRRDQLGTQGERAEPRLPHERDESSDSQAPGAPGTAPSAPDQSGAGARKGEGR
jgi:hypothetical protein